MELLNGEQISFFHLSDPDFVRMSDEEINDKYIKGEVRIVTEQARYPLPSILPMLDSGGYKLNPEFQRRHRWSNIQKSLLIESFIMNVPVPPIFLYEDSYSHYEVMDGLQRLTAIKEFYSDKFRLEGLEKWPELNGKIYSALPTQIRRGIDRRYLSSIILLKETAKNDFEEIKLKQLVFERINSGGVKLEPQESRNAVFNGPLNKLCIELARNIYLCKMWDIPEPTNDEIINKNISDELLDNASFKEMEDVELVLRFFANRQRDILFKKSKNFREFLDNYLRYGNNISSGTMLQMSNVFSSTIEFVYELFGEKAFWLYRQRNGRWNWYQRPTTAVYDPLMAVATRYVNNPIILSKKHEIDTIMSAFYKENYNEFAGRNTNPSILTERESKFYKLFEQLAK